MEYTYFVVFENEDIKGNCTATRKRKIETREDIVELEKAIAKSENVDSVILLNYKLLGKEV